MTSQNVRRAKRDRRPVMALKCKP